nr:MAG TPA: hypothetical protein [Caudoviricetes sp.]
MIAHIHISPFINYFYLLSLLILYTNNTFYILITSHLYININ